jgi:hypothetical protein
MSGRKAARSQNQMSSGRRLFDSVGILWLGLIRCFISRKKVTTERLFSYRIGSFPQRLCSRPPSAIAITTRISSGRGASGIDTVMVSK